MPIKNQNNCIIIILCIFNIKIKLLIPTASRYFCENQYETGWEFRYI